MDKLKILRRGDLLAELGLGDRPIEIGRAAGCDVVLDDPDRAARQFLVATRRGTVVVYDVSGGKRALARENHLPYGKPLRVGRDHRLLRERMPSPEAAAPEPGTERLHAGARSCRGLRVLVQRPGELRSVRVIERPLLVGRAEDSDIVLADPAVTARHCRLEPTAQGLLVRDLGSRNGTYVNGACVHSASVGAGARLCVGRSELHIVGGEGWRRSGPTLIAESPAMLDVLAQARRAAELSWPVLIRGESGTGKEGLAGLLHSAGRRADGPFVAVNAGGVPRDLIEAELFGHERGAFTGASQLHRGVFEQAHGGTLFLDEIGELPLSLQARLLRVLETGELRRVGAESSLRVDVRLITATHRDLRAMVSEGSFRQDLFYRIVGLVLDVPPLRQRPEDVRALVPHFLSRMADDVGVRSLTPQALTCLLAYPWPGNARELRNVLAAAAAATSLPVLDRDDIDRALERIGGAGSRVVPAEALQQAVAVHGGNLSAAARALGMPRSTLRDRLRAPR